MVIPAYYLFTRFLINYFEGSLNTYSSTVYVNIYKYFILSAQYTILVIKQTNPIIEFVVKNIRIGQFRIYIYIYISIKYTSKYIYTSV